MGTPLVVVHGSVGEEPVAGFVAALQAAVGAGLAALHDGGTAADAVSAALDSPPGDRRGCLVVAGDGRIAAGCGGGTRGRTKAASDGAGGPGRYADSERGVLCAGDPALCRSLARQVARRAASADAVTAVAWAVAMADERGSDLALVVYERSSGTLTICHNSRFAVVIGTEGHRETLLAAPRAVKCWTPFAPTLDPATVLKGACPSRPPDLAGLSLLSGTPRDDEREPETVARRS